MKTRIALGMALGLSLFARSASASSPPSPSPPPDPAIGGTGQGQAIAAWCSDVRKEVRRLKWKVEPCPEGIEWKVGGESVQGRPLVYAEFGDVTSDNTTLVLTMVHGDEITPLYLGLQLVHWLKQHAKESPKAHVVIAPLVNPDSFFRKPKTRFNARGVDVNRNFPTRDWEDRALKAWKKRFKSDPRRYPGSAPGSEPETIFQQELLKRVRPQKILSVHAPLNFTDYDGPNSLALATFPKEYIRECLKLRSKLKAISGGFYPGSLGNFAGQEMGIPTITLELPSADPAKANAYWNRFSEGIRTMIEFVVPPNVSRLKADPSTQG